jgi:hypothetical protein
MASIEASPPTGKEVVNPNRGVDPIDSVRPTQPNHADGAAKIKPADRLSETGNGEFNALDQVRSDTYLGRAGHQAMLLGKGLIVGMALTPINSQIDQ